MQHDIVQKKLNFYLWDSSRLKDTKSGASAIEAGNEFQKGMVRGKKLFL